MIIFGRVENQSIWSKYSDLTRVLGPQKVAFWKGNGTPQFKEIYVGEIL